MTSTMATVSEEIYEAAWSVARDLDEYAREAALSLAAFAFVYVALCALVYGRHRRPDRTVAASKRALLVTAHPDDETMFFGPTLLHLIRSGVDVHLLCLSDGNFQNRGKERRAELYDACEVLNVKKHSIFLCIDQSMPDDQNVRWPFDHVADIILHYIEALSIDTLITFDKGGVSRHPNHSSIYFAVAKLCMEKRFPEECKFFTLDTVNILRKYWGYLDLLVSFVFSSHWFVLTWKDSKIVTRAMKKHKSQMVWFRYLYLIFSRYIIINTLQNITSTDLELDLQLED